MGIKIEQKQTTIPVEIGDLLFAFDVSDDNIKKFYTSIAATEEKINKLEMKMKKGNDNIPVEFSDLKLIMEAVLDSIFGSGTFTKIYEQTPSLSLITDYFYQITQGLEEEFASLNRNKKLNKYMKR